jgi:hypothetical protein
MSTGIRFWSITPAKVTDMNPGEHGQRHPGEALVRRKVMEALAPFVGPERSGAIEQYIFRLVTARRLG